MDDKDARRSRVPAGTFGDSTPPSSAEGDDPAPVSDRRRFTNTLTGTGKGAFGDTDPPPVARMIPKRTGNTLVGHPSLPPPVPSGASAPVLSPPKWRGARPYLEGEEPQPRVSSIPTPPPTPEQAKSGGVPIGVMRSKVTTKVGQPVAQPPTAAAQQPIDATIERMLEGQASVRMQVEAEGDSIPEIPLDQLPIEELEDSLPRVPKAALAAVRAAEAQAKSSAAAQAQSAPGTSAATAESEPAAAAGFVSSVAPAEVVRRPRKDDSQAAMGLLAVAVFALLFVGGWYATRGGYAPSRPAAAAAPAPATVAPSGPSDLAPAPAAALTTPEPPAAPEPESEPEVEAAKGAPATGEQTIKRAAARPRSTTKSEAHAPPEPAAEVDDEEESAESAEGEQDVLTVKPQIDPESLPDIPGREEVRAALEPLRPAIAECSRGARGVAQLDITVSSSGAVSHAVVGGDFAGTAEGSCIARAARGAQFTPFKKPRFRVIYPFSL